MEVFGSIDTNKNGVIEREELFAALQTMYVPGKVLD